MVFWQWVNQSFNALVNYTNRNAKSEVSSTQLGVAYVSATTSALVTALGLKSFLEKRAGSLLQRYVPFAAVAAANCINIPLMRQSELINGIAVYDENGNAVTESRVITRFKLFPFENHYWIISLFITVGRCQRNNAGCSLTHHDGCAWNELSWIPYFLKNEFFD